MAINTDSPEVTSLRLAVERRFGHPVESRSHFSKLAQEIELNTKEHIAENTLRRIWGKMKGYDTVFTRTLDVISRYAGYKHWADFTLTLEQTNPRESDVLRKSTHGTHSIKADELTPGDRIRIGWLPNRECVVEFIGGRTFKAITTQNSTLQCGDTFECSIMIKGFPLFIDNLVHGGEHCLRYSIGINNGLTTLERV